MYLPAFHDPPVKTPRQVGESKPNWKHGIIKLVLQTSQNVEHGFVFFLSTPCLYLCLCLCLCVCFCLCLSPCLCSVVPEFCIMAEFNMIFSLFMSVINMQMYSVEIINHIREKQQGSLAGRHGLVMSQDKPDSEARQADTHLGFLVVLCVPK